MTDRLTSQLSAADPLSPQTYAARSLGTDTHPVDSLPPDAYAADSPPGLAGVDASWAAEASAQIAAAVVAADRGASLRRRRTRRRTRLVALALSAAVVVPTGAWAAGFLAQTGLFGAPGQTENDTSEFIDVCASDFPAYYATLPVPNSAPPAGLTWPQIRTFVVTRMASTNASSCPSPGAVMQRTGLLSQPLFVAQSVYACRALQAHRDGNDAAVRENLQGVADMFDAQEALGVLGDRAWVPWRDAAARGEFAGVQAFIDANVVGATTPEGVCR